MEQLNTYTPTELLKLINNIKVEHERLKKEIVDHSYEAEELEKKINDKLAALKSTEDRYVALIEELNNRDNGI
jgi:hypothetical protein